MCMLCMFVGAKCTDLPGSLALALGHIHTSYVVYVHGGWSALTLSNGPDVGDKRG